ncbi:hypothetical protein, partial [Mesorhizobium sp.]|uniref:hypothetical protein n=1 Tax=Mesorhizobium sp. TaxID=1871066 RepID=UPI0011FD343D
MSDADFRSKARPIGWQDIVNPNLTRRGLIGGLVASPVALYAGIGRASENAWYDLEFEISPDLSSVAVLEVKVIPQTPMQDCGEGERPEIRSVECRWDIPAAAFGPDAFFDMDEPGPNQICQASPPPQRTIYVRNVQYGLRFTKEDKEPIAPAVGSKNKPGFVAFIFNRPG